ncbi:hypothetical protein SynBIOSE41_01786 [Synechococcus sp. BIOS-E4-1]|nr:hypothetical protein SynBIOSE41_01786 [Synechococcus sp. BIOS-E4-1]
MKIAANHGIEISTEDLLTAFKSKMSELSKEELEAVSGGKGAPQQAHCPAAAKAATKELNGQLLGIELDLL